MEVISPLGTEHRVEHGMEPAPAAVPRTVENPTCLEVLRGFTLEAGKETQKKLGYSATTSSLQI